MIKYKKILKHNVFYYIGYFLSRFWHNVVFYKKVQFVDTDKIPVNEQVIIGSNHQNALLDPLANLYSKIHFPTFLARSDLFSKKIVANLMLFLRILPIYRIRDGKENLSKNKDTFKYSIDIIRHKIPLIMYPEARHTDKRSLLPMKKGLSRIALLCAAEDNFEKDLYVVPAGITYSNYFNFRTNLLVIYDDPINVKKYKDLYNENPEKAFSKLRYDLYEKIIPLAIHIKNLEFYDEYESAREIFDYPYAKEKEKKLKKLYDKFLIDKEIIAKFDEYYEKDKEKFKVFAEKISSYTKKLKEAKLKDYLFDKPVNVLKNIILSLFVILMLPLHLLSYVNFLIPVGAPELLVKKFKDAQFHSSLRFAGNYLIIHLWALLWFVMLWIFTDIWWLKWAIIPVLPFWQIGWFEMRRLIKKLIGQWRYTFNKKNREQLKSQRDELLKIFETI